MSGFALSHVGIVVPDLDAATARLAKLLGIAPEPILENRAQGVRLVQFHLPNSRIELLSPLSETGPVAAFLARNPRGGLHHVALAHPDLVAALAALAVEGVVPIAPPGINVFGRRFAFLPPADVFGVLTEIEESATLSGPGAAP